MARPDPDAAYALTRCRLSEADIQAMEMGSDIDRQTKPIVGFHIFGKCPRCGHETSDVFPVEYITEDVGGSGGIPPLSRFTVKFQQQTVQADEKLARLQAKLPRPSRASVAVLHCHCVLPHSGDNGNLGCNAEWLLYVQYNLNSRQIDSIRTIPAATEYRYWAAADSLSLATTNSLTSVQNTAGKWVTSLGAIVGLLGAATVITGRDTFQELDGTAQGWLIGFAALFVVASAVSIFLANLASSGFPSVRSPRDPLDLVDGDLWPIRQARLAASKLRIATYCASIALAGAACAVGITWLGHGVPSDAKIDIVVSKPSPSPICGTLSTAQPRPAIPGVINFQPTGAASPSTYPLTALEGITPYTC
jgi:hypothetical protein